MLVGVRLGNRCRRALAQLGQTVFAFILFVVTPFLVERQEAVEQLDSADRAQGGLVVRRRDVHGRALKARAFHLAGHGAAPDQLVEAGHVLIERQFLGQARETGRADRLVRFLGILGLGRIHARRRRNV